MSDKERMLNEKVAAYDLFKILSAGFDKREGEWWVNIGAWRDEDQNMIDSFSGEGRSLDDAVLDAIAQEEAKAATD